MLTTTRSIIDSLHASAKTYSEQGKALAATAPHTAHFFVKQSLECMALARSLQS